MLGVREVQVTFDLSKADWAAWAQAIGSILAIVGAFLIARHQHALQRQAAEQRSVTDEIDVLDSSTPASAFALPATTSDWALTR